MALWAHQQVVLDGQASDSVLVLSGVPQWVVLGRVIFPIYKYDLSDIVRSSVCLFVKVYTMYIDIK